MKEAGKAPWSAKTRDIEAAADILSGTPDEQIETIHACFAFLGSSSGRTFLGTGIVSYSMNALRTQQAVTTLASQLLRRKLPFTDDDLLVWLAASPDAIHVYPAKSVLTAIKRRLDGNVPDGAIARGLKAFFKAMKGNSSYADARALRDRAELLLAASTDGVPDIRPVDAWTVALLKDLEAMPATPKTAWAALIAHAAGATSAKPSATWASEATRIIATVDTDAFSDTMATVLDAIGTAAPFPVKVSSLLRGGADADGDARLVSLKYNDTLRGLVWSAGLSDDATLIPRLGDAAERCFAKLRNHGPLAPKIGNACLYALSQHGSHAAVGQLTRLRTRVKHASVRKQLDKALARAAERAGVSTADLEDMAVPTCGLTGVGVRRATVGEFEAELTITGVHTTQLAWRGASGKTQKSVPKAVKADSADDLAAFRKSAKEIKQILPAQRDRIERMLLSRRTLPFSEWKTRYLDHPLVGFLTRRLVWCAGDQDQSRVVACADGTLTDIEGQEVRVSAKTPMRLWHPLDSDVETVTAWRRWLGDAGLTQPFKQVHREIYLLTDAERTTGTYSNRFAAHILKQHQFHALAQQRGWRYTLQGDWDSHNTPHIELPELGWRVEFWVDAARGAEAEFAASGVFLYIVTDQVRFCRSQQAGPEELEQVPAIVFSELMRDVDLFVGVCSVGNDPAWSDGGEHGHYADYWTSYAFGDLGETAKTRRELLAELIPKLRIADQCSIEDRFLSVRGSLRTYRIHLGSGNVLMSPGNQYLCIVPGRQTRSPSTRILLPFEGDTMLAIILSKALMLASDKTIKDRTILSQIQRR